MLTTHYLEEAEELADRLAIMHQGRIVRAGTPAEVAASQPARISFKLPGDAREPVPALAGTRASVMQETADLQRTLTALLEWAKSRDLVPGALDARPTSLEQAFLAMAASSGNRAFLGRAVRYLVGEAGVRQFLDIGTGLPAANNTHEVAQGAAPQCRVVHVDNAPGMVSGATRHERRASLAVNPGCWHAWPMGACVTLTLTQECSPWRSRPVLAASRRRPRTTTATKHAARRIRRSGRQSTRWPGRGRRA